MNRAYLYAAILGTPSDIDTQLGSRVTCEGHPQRRQRYRLQPLAYLAYLRPDHAVLSSARTMTQPYVLRKKIG